jgi:toxin ParE1/3/4
MKSIRTTSLADEDLAIAASYYEDLQSGLGARLIDAVETTFASIAHLPLAGGVIKEDIRRRLVPGFPYAVLYQVKDEIVVVCLADLRRRPEYWSERC